MLSNQGDDVEGVRKMSKTVAIIGSRGYPSYYGGFETLIRRLAPYLIEDGWDVTVYGRPGATNAVDPGRNRSVETVETRGIETKSLSTLSYGLTSVAHAAKQKPDVALVLNVANGYWLPILKLRSIPTVVNVDGIEWERAKWGKSAKAVFKLGASLTAKFATELVSDSVEIRSRWRQDYQRDSNFIPYGGEEVAVAAPPQGLPAFGYILLVARFVPENTVPEFILAAERLGKRWPVVIVGSSGYGGDVEKQVAELALRVPGVTWLGHVQDDELLFALWQNAGAYFHGHSVGGTNPALVQAMACGASIVARDTVYNREVLQDCAVFALPSPDAIYSAIAELMNDPEKILRLGKMARARAKDAYTWDGVCSQYSNLLTQTADGIRRRQSKTGVETRA